MNIRSTPLVPRQVSRIFSLFGKFQPLFIASFFFIRDFRSKCCKKIGTGLLLRFHTEWFWMHFSTNFVHTVPLYKSKLFISRSCPLLVLETVLRRPRRVDVKKGVKNYQGPKTAFLNFFFKKNLNFPSSVFFYYIF